MSNSAIGFEQIRNTIIKGITCEFLPLIILGASESLLETLPAVIRYNIAIFVLILTLYGYIICWISTYKYARYKGYPNYFGLLGILNIVGLSFVFLLTNKNTANYTYSGKKSLVYFSISSIFISYIAISILFLPLLVIVTAYIGNVGIGEAFDYLDNEDYSVILSIPIEIIIAWYLFREMKKSNIDFQQIVGSLKKINFKLPIGLAIIKYFFAWGLSSITLYCLSFVIPKYVENQINKEYVTTPLGWVFYAIGALIFAPIIEEVLFRGIIFQKLAIKKNIVKALLISAIIFALIHFRYDVISLFTSGIILAILYLKTKQLIIPIIYHFFYNFIVLMRLLYLQLFSNVDRSIPTTIAEYQQQFIDSFELKILFIALSAPYICYFIYKNFPRNYDIENLPYFANQRTFRR